MLSSFAPGAWFVNFGERPDCHKTPAHRNAYCQSAVSRIGNIGNPLTDTFSVSRCACRTAKVLSLFYRSEAAFHYIHQGLDRELNKQKRFRYEIIAAAHGR